MTRNTDANCGNCPFGKENSLDPLTVDCHRYPPVYIEGVKHDDGEYDRWGFPSHAISSVCGEHPDFFNRVVAQVEEPRTHNPHAAGSSPAPATTFAGVAQLVGNSPCKGDDAGSSPATSSTFATHTHGVTSPGPAAGTDGSTLPFVGPGATQDLLDAMRNFLSTWSSGADKA